MRSRPIAVGLVLSVAVAACAGDDGPDTTNSDTTPAATTSASVDQQPPVTDGFVAGTSEVEPAPTEPAPTASVTTESVATVPTDAAAPSTPPITADDVGAPGVGDALYPMMGNGGYDVTNYLIEVAIDVDQNTIDAVTTIDATTTEDLERFNLDFAGLDVASVTVDGAEADFDRTGSELVVTPQQRLGADAEFSVSVTYSGTPEPIDDPGIPFTTLGWQNTDGTVYVASEPSGAISWFPSNNHPSDKATFEFRITADSELTAVANGVLVGTEQNAIDAGTTTTTWRMNDPMTTYLAAIYVGDFERRESTTDDGLVIRNYFPPEFADDLEADFALTADVIDFYEELFGADYPFEEYGSIVLPFPTGFALENQTISVHGLDATDSYTIAHEILHQWAGDSVTVAQWQDIWMLEGFATYLAFMYHEDRGLRSEIEPRGMYAALAGAGTVGPAEVPIEELFGLSVYFRGGMALHGLRVEVGDETFTEIMRAYYAANAGERVSTAEFQAIVSDVAGADALAVLDSWLFGTDLPPFP